MESSHEISNLSWGEFLRSWNWQQGEHITIVGPVGSGKTTLGLELMQYRKYQIVLATKPRDPLITELKDKGYWVVRDWPPPPVPKVVFWPKMKSPADITDQREALRLALFEIYRGGGYAVFMDEVRYFTQTLGLKSLVELLWLQGRSLGVSVVAGTQRPRHIPLEAYDQATHLFLFRESDMQNLRRLSELGAVNSRALMDAVMHLERHRFVYVDTRTGRMVESQVEI